MYKTALGTAPFNTEIMLWGEVAYAVGGLCSFFPAQETPRSPADPVISCLRPGRALSSEALPQLRLGPSPRS